MARTGCVGLGSGGVATGAGLGSGGVATGAGLGSGGVATGAGLGSRGVATGAGLGSARTLGVSSKTASLHTWLSGSVAVRATESSVPDRQNGERGCASLHS